MRHAANSLVLCAMVLFSSAVPAWAAKAYKIYVVNRYGAYDIVCDAYTVKKDDHVWDILRRKGSIAEQDFPRFVQILKDMNPGVKNVDKIYPRQKILIPLKEMPAKKSGGQSGPRYITIPMLPDVLYKSHHVSAGECLSKIIAARLQVRWDALTDAYFKVFRRLNPKIKNLDLIYPGQTIRIPELSFEKALAAEKPASVAPVGQQATEGLSDKKPEAEAEPEELIAAKGTQNASVQDEKGLGKPEAEQLPVEKIMPALSTKSPVVKTKTAENTRPTESGTKNLHAHHESEAPAPMSHGIKAKTKTQASPGPTPADISTTSSRRAGSANKIPGPGRRISNEGVHVVTSERALYTPGWQTVVSMVAPHMGARLLAYGHCYFPARQQDDVVLDLSAFPVVAFDDGQHVVFEKGARLPGYAEGFIRASWKDLVIIHTDRHEPDNAVLDRVFRAVYGQGVRKEAALSLLDDSVRVILRGDWVFSFADKKHKFPRWCCITRIEDSKEYTASSMVAYLAEKGIEVLDILKKGDGQYFRQPLFKHNSQPVGMPTIDGSGGEAFVSGFVHALGLTYERQVPMSFDYAGFQVRTTANIIYGKGGSDLVIDFGAFYGDAKTAIEAGGMQVVSVPYNDDLFRVARRILDAMGSAYVMDPSLVVANRRLSRASTITIPGLLITGERGDKILLVRKGLHPTVLAFLNGQQIKAFRVKKRLAGQRSQPTKVARSQGHE